MHCSTLIVHLVPSRLIRLLLVDSFLFVTFEFSQFIHLCRTEINWKYMNFVTLLLPDWVQMNLYVQLRIHGEIYYKVHFVLRHFNAKFKRCNVALFTYFFVILSTLIIISIFPQKIEIFLTDFLISHKTHVKTSTNSYRLWIFYTL